MLIARFQNRLLTNDALAIHFSLGTESVMNEPMPSQKLDSVVTEVIDGDAIGEDIVVLARA